MRRRRHVLQITPKTTIGTLCLTGLTVLDSSTCSIYWKPQAQPGVAGMLAVEAFRPSVAPKPNRADFVTSLGTSQTSWDVTEAGADKETSFESQKQKQKKHRETVTVTTTENRKRTTSKDVSTLMAPPTGTTAKQRESVESQPKVAAVSGVVQLISSTEQFLRALQDNSQDDSSPLLVVTYTASYCRICHRAAMILKKIASTLPGSTVSFARFESAGKNKSKNSRQALTAEELRSLGVTKFPFVQIYRRGQCVASFAGGPSHLFGRRVRDTVEMCLARSELEWMAFQDQFANEIASNMAAREQLLMQNSSA